MLQASIIIPYYNDVETLRGTIKSLYDTIDIDKFEVIVVCDGGKERFEDKMPLNMRHIEHFVNLGVGAAFDTGVNAARSENILLMGADIRFKDNGWASRMLKIVEKQDKALVCTGCKSHGKDSIYYGADVIFKVKNENLSDKHPLKKDKDYRAALEGKWRPRTERGVYPIPSLMGAFYGVRKSWYEYVKGFELHYKWGVLEPYISLKSWILGGQILCDSDNLVEHIWRKPRRSADFAALMYNQMMTSGVVFGPYGVKYAEHLCEYKSHTWDIASEMYNEKMESISQVADYIRKNRIMEPRYLEAMMVKLSVEYNKVKTHYENPIEEQVNE